MCVSVRVCVVKHEYYCIYSVFFKVEDRQVFIYGHWSLTRGVWSRRLQNGSFLDTQLLM